MVDNPHHEQGADRTPAPRSYHWTPRLQREFLEQIAETGSVKVACTSVRMSPSAAYQLKQRPEGAAFRIGWAAAVLIARGRLADELLDRAIYGHEEMTSILREDDRSFVRRRRYESRLGLAMLARLDRMVETRARDGEEMLAQIVAGDWAAFLTLFDIDADNRDAAGHGAALGLWLAVRDNRANPIATLWRGSEIANEVAQISAGSSEEAEAAPSPEKAAADMSVWYDEDRREWRTNFPPPADFIGDEEGEFGDPDYERTLDDDEQEAWEDVRERATAPLRRAGEAARRAWFGLPAPANDPAPDHDQARNRSASG